MSFAIFDPIAPGRRPLVALTLALWMCVAQFGCGGCSDEDSKAPSDQPRQASHDASSSASSDASMHDQRTVYGMPLPPSVRGIERRGTEVRVKTAMSLDEVADFFEARLTDYEVLRPGEEVRAVGLRDYMPHAYAYPYGPFSFITYHPARKPRDKPKADASGASEAASASADSEDESTPPIFERKHGARVMDRTADGKLLAPGARWGEPYTPPPGSPLHKEHFRSNFGRPYGEWVPQ